jgi:hypothetical protein
VCVVHTIKEIEREKEKKEIFRRKSCATKAFDDNDVDGIG